MYSFQIPDKDLERRRCGQKIDPVTGDIYTEDIYNPDKPTKEVSDVLSRVGVIKIVIVINCN